MIGLDVLDKQLIQIGLNIQRTREREIKEFKPIFESLVVEILGLEEFELKYYPSWKDGDEEKIKALLKEKREIDRQTKRTNSGPHRDRYLFYSQGKNYADFASTGQTRLLSLALRVAQALFFQKKTGKKPILLLDDVLLELDPGKRAQFIKRLPPYEQAFFTFLPDSGWGNFKTKESRVYWVQQGRLEDEGSKETGGTASADFASAK